MSGSTSGRSCRRYPRTTDVSVVDKPTPMLDESALRALVPLVLAGLVRRGEDFDAAEDALQEALLEALRVWPEHPPRDPSAWLVTVATRRLVDARRSDAARQRRQAATFAEPRAAGPNPQAGDDTLLLLFCCCHPDLASASQVALTLRAVGGLTTPEIADAFFVPEATMAQRISRAKRTIAGPPARRLDQPGDLAVVLRVLPRLHGGSFWTARPGGPGGRGDPAGPPTDPRHRGTGSTRAAGADAAEPRPPRGAIGLRRSHRDARPTGPPPLGPARTSTTNRPGRACRSAALVSAFDSCSGETKMNSSGPQAATSAAARALADCAEFSSVAGIPAARRCASWSSCSAINGDTTTVGPPRSSPAS
jgi:RNA polymerase sigma factor (sigma-70 family)